MSTAAAPSLPPPLSTDAINRFRIAHSDRELRPIIRRLNRFPHLERIPHPEPAEGQEPVDHVKERQVEEEITRLEVQKWRFSVERMLASVRNLARQREAYLQQADSTVARTAELRTTLEQEKEQLARELAQRENWIKCDEVAKKILARGKTRKELNDQIATLEASIAEHRSAYDSVVAVAQARAETFARISDLVDECRAIKLLESTAVEELIDEETPAQSAAAAQRLSAQSLPFQPGGSSRPAASVSASAPASRSGSPGPSGHSHLPARPAASRATSARYASTSTPPGRGQANLPSRPSNLRHLARQGSHASSLEDGELGEEDGEVKEGMKRKAEGDGRNDGRERRARK